MNVQSAPAAMAERRDLHGSPRWHGYQPLLARGLWLALIGLTLAISLVSLPAYLTQLQTPCGRTACEYQQLTSWQVEALKGIGVSLEGVPRGYGHAQAHQPGTLLGSQRADRLAPT